MFVRRDTDKLTISTSKIHCLAAPISPLPFPKVQNFRFSVPYPPPPNLNLSVRFRNQFGVRFLKSLGNLQLTRLGRPSDPRQVRKRFGFGQLWRFGGKEILRILQVTESNSSQLHCLIIRLSGVRVPVGPPIKSMS